MATVKFLLRNKNTSRSVSINYDIHLSSNVRLRGATNVKVLPQYWDQENQRIRNVTALSKTKDSLSKKLRTFKAFALDQVDNYETTNITEIKELLKNDIAIHLGKKEKENDEVITFYSFVDKFIEQSNSRVNEKNGRKLAPKTIQDYTRTLDHIKKYEKIQNFPISFDTINLDFYYGFKDYLELKYAVNTVGKFIKNIKLFMNAATEQGYNTNLSYKNKHFIKPSISVENIYLDQKELQKIINLDLKNNPTKDRARDLFIIGAYTGLRISDLNLLTKENIKKIGEKHFFQITVKKTDKYLAIPLHPEVKKILKKNNGKPPNKMLPQKINDKLSKIGKQAEINEKITINSTMGGRKITTTKPKFDLIKNHTARRSFCTNAYISGMPTLDIMAISGHSTEKAFLNYIKITADERAVKIGENSFFNP
jgi:integrase